MFARLAWIGSWAAGGWRCPRLASRSGLCDCTGCGSGLRAGPPDNRHVRGLVSAIRVSVMGQVAGGLSTCPWLMTAGSGLQLGELSSRDHTLYQPRALEQCKGRHIWTGRCWRPLQMALDPTPRGVYLPTQQKNSWNDIPVQFGRNGRRGRRLGHKLRRGR